MKHGKLLILVTSLSDICDVQVVKNPTVLRDMGGDPSKYKVPQKGRLFAPYVYLSVAVHSSGEIEILLVLSLDCSSVPRSSVCMRSLLSSCEQLVMNSL